MQVVTSGATIVPPTRSRKPVFCRSWGGGLPVAGDDPGKVASPNPPRNVIQQVEVGAVGCREPVMEVNRDKQYSTLNDRIAVLGDASGVTRAVVVVQG